jgi:hypothetical protein
MSPLINAQGLSRSLPDHGKNRKPSEQKIIQPRPRGDLKLWRVCGWRLTGRIPNLLKRAMESAWFRDLVGGGVRSILITPVKAVRPNVLANSPSTIRCKMLKNRRTDELSGPRRDDRQTGGKNR